MGPFWCRFCGIISQKWGKNGQKGAKISVFLLLISNLCVFVCCSLFDTYAIFLIEKVIINNWGGGVRAIFGSFWPGIDLRKGLH
jgi:hypothetical protein